LTINKGIPRPAATLPIKIGTGSLLPPPHKLWLGQQRGTAVQSPLVKGVAMLIAGGLVAARYND